MSRPMPAPGPRTPIPARSLSCSTAWNGRTPHSAHARNGLPNSTPPSERCSPRDCRSCCIGEKNSFRSTTTRSCPFWATSTRTRSAGRRRNAGRRSGKPWNRTFAVFWQAVIPCCTSGNCCSSIGTVISKRPIGPTRIHRSPMPMGGCWGYSARRRTPAPPKSSVSAGWGLCAIWAACPAPVPPTRRTPAG